MKKLGRNCSVVVYNKIKKERSKCEKVKKKKQKTCNTVCEEKLFRIFRFQWTRINLMKKKIV
jgi:hypothetical protein